MHKGLALSRSRGAGRNARTRERIGAVVPSRSVAAGVPGAGGAPRQGRVRGGGRPGAPGAREAGARGRLRSTINGASKLRSRPFRHFATRGKKQPRASTTDADARVMKMPDGGFRPGYNVQLATAGSEMGGPRTIVGVLVTNIGSDMGSVTPMLEDIKARTGHAPDAAPGGRAITRSTRASSGDPCGRRGHHRDSEGRTVRDQDHVRPEVAAWRERMKTEKAKRAYRARAGTLRTSNAHLKCHHGTAQSSSEVSRRSPASRFSAPSQQRPRSREPLSPEPAAVESAPTIQQSARRADLAGSCAPAFMPGEW